MKVCTKCGTQNADSTLFCTSCGNSLAAEAAPVNPTPVAAPVNPTPAAAPNAYAAYANPNVNPYVAPNVNPNVNPYVNPNANPYATPNANPNANTTKSKDTIGALVAFLHNMFALFYVAFSYLAVVYAYVGESGYYYTSHYYWFEGGFVIAALVAAIPLFILGIANLVLSLTKKGDLKVTLSGAFRFFASLAALVVAICSLAEHA